MFSAGSASAQELDFMQEEGWVFNQPSAPTQEIQYVPAAQGSYEAEIYAACEVHRCDPNQLIRVMNCESGGDHSAVGPNGERGIFQYHPNGMWPEMAGAGPYEQIWHAAEQFANGLGYHWVCR
jgi:hypothetical protein